MQPGFLQFDRDEAMFYFAQQRALMICTGSWDYYSIKHQSPFEIGLFRIPLPSASHPVYGPQVLGPRAELGAGIGAYFFVSQQSQHPEQAVDFLRFLTSRLGNQTFVNVSRGLPVIRGAKPVSDVEPFLPSTDGMPPGMQIAPLMWGSGELYRVQSNLMHNLMARDGSVESFVDAFQAEAPAAADRDAMRTAQGQIDSVRRMDALMLSTLMLDQDAEAYPGLMETQAAREANYYWIESLRNKSKQGP
jgi:ABC-type glycerol-3-phosphate transport system substrate-binding protein